MTMTMIMMMTMVMMVMMMMTMMTMVTMMMNVMLTRTCAGTAPPGGNSFSPPATRPSFLATRVEKIFDLFFSFFFATVYKIDKTTFVLTCRHTRLEKVPDLLTINLPTRLRIFSPRGALALEFGEAIFDKKIEAQ